MTDFPGFYFDGMNRANTAEVTLNNTTGSPNNIANLTRKFDIDTGDKVRQAIIVSGSYCIVGNQSGKVMSLATADGSTRWSVTPGTGAAVKGACYASGGQIFVPTNKLYALNETTGATNWSFNINGTSVLGCPIVTGGNVIFMDDVAYIYAVPTGGGAAAWSANLAAAGPFTGLSGAVALYGGNVYFPFGTSIRSFNATTGAAVRTFSVRGGIGGPPTLATDPSGVTHLIFPSADHYIYDFNADTGALIWADRQSGTADCGVAIDTVNGYCFTGSHNWNMESHNLYTGKLRWLKTATNSASVQATACCCPNAPSDTSGTGLVFTAWMAQDGRIVGWASTDSPGGHNPLFKYPSAAGGLWNNVTTVKDVYCSPTVVNASAFIGTDSGRVFKFGI